MACCVGDVSRGQCVQYTNQIDGWTKPGLVLPPLNTVQEPGAINNVRREAAFQVRAILCFLAVSTHPSMSPILDPQPTGMAGRLWVQLALMP